MTEQKDREYLQDKEVVFASIVLEEDTKDQSKVKKVILETIDDTRITYKPRVKRKVHENGFERIREECMSVDELPQVLKDIAKAIRSKGKVKVKCAYAKWNTQDKEGAPVSYRYVQSTNVLNDKWSLVTEKTIEEKVE